MKTVLQSLLAFLMLAAFSQTALAQATTGYNIRVKIDDFDNDTLILGYHRGEQLLVKDTLTARTSKGDWVFEGEEPLPGGLYFVFLQGTGAYFDFLVPDEEAQKKLVLHTKFDETRNLYKNLKVKGSSENLIFLEYILEGMAQDKEARALQQKLAKASEEEKKALQKEGLQLSKTRRAQQEALYKKYPNTLIGNMIGASIRPEAPEGMSREDAFYYIKNHYWDNFDWSDERLIRTPVLESKMAFWVDRLTVRSPDSIAAAIGYMLDRFKASGNRDLFRYMAGNYLNEYAKSKIICMDAVYVYIGEKYYCSGEADWVDSVQLEKICENVRSLKPLQCGLYAPNIRLKKMDGTPISLYDVKAEYTVLYFWDPTCGNCSKTSAKLVPVYEEFKDKGLEIFGVCSKSWKEIDQCKKKIEEKQMDFINTTEEPYPLAVAKKTYDLKANPYLILLDKDKKILLKRIDPNQLKEILERELGSEEDPAVKDAVEAELQKKEQENLNGSKG
jgi:peroxiredoxin